MPSLTSIHGQIFYLEEVFFVYFQKIGSTAEQNITQVTEKPELGHISLLHVLGQETPVGQGGRDGKKISVQQQEQIRKQLSPFTFCLPMQYRTPFINDRHWKMIQGVLSILSLCYFLEVKHCDIMRNQKYVFIYLPVKMRNLLHLSSYHHRSV